MLDPDAPPLKPSSSSSSLMISMAIVLVLAVAALVFFVPQEMLAENSKAIESWRNFFIMLAAAFGIPFVIWRTSVAQQQANASERQAKTTEKRLRNEIYEKGCDDARKQHSLRTLGWHIQFKGPSKRKAR